MDEELPLGLVAFGPGSLSLGRPLLRPGNPPHLLHRGDHPSMRGHGEGVRRTCRPRPGHRAGVVVPGHHRRPHRPGPPPDEVGGAAGHLPPGRTATYWCAPTVGTRRSSIGSGPTRWWRASPGGSTPDATTEQLEHIATLIPDEWLAPSATGTPEQCAEAVRGQLSTGVRRRHPARRHPDRAGSRGGGLPGHRSAELTRSRARSVCRTLRTAAPSALPLPAHCRSLRTAAPCALPLPAHCRSLRTSAPRHLGTSPPGRTAPLFA